MGNKKKYTLKFMKSGGIVRTLQGGKQTRVHSEEDYTPVSKNFKTALRFKKFIRKLTGKSVDFDPIAGAIYELEGVYRQENGMHCFKKY